MDATNNNARTLRTTTEWKEQAEKEGDVQGAKVAEFHEKIGAPDPVHLERTVYGRTKEEEAKSLLIDIACDFNSASEALREQLGRYSRDPRILRAFLIAEEVSELMLALAARDEVRVADGLADIEYVCKGSSIAFDLPSKACFDEVHSSNMTKHTAIGAAGNTSEDRGKGDTYIAPNMHLTIEEWRSYAD